MTDGFAVRQGWLPAAAALALAGTTALLIAGSTSAHPWVVSRIAIVGFVVLAMGTAIGSEQAVGLASAPILGSALLGATTSGDPAWGRSMMIGCLWYLAVEAAMASIEQRDGTRRSAAVGNQRLQEVSTVVILALAVGLLGAAASSLAPERTFIVRTLVVAAVLVALAGAVRHLVNTGPLDES